MIDIRGKAKTGRPKKASYREGRDRQINIRVSADELRKIDKLAFYFGVTRTDLLIMLVEAELKTIRRTNKHEEL